MTTTDISTAAQKGTEAQTRRGGSGDPNPRTSHTFGEIHSAPAGAGPNLPADQMGRNTHAAHVAGEPNPRISQVADDAQTRSAGAGLHFPDGQCSFDNQVEDATGEPHLLTGHLVIGPHRHNAGEHLPPQSAVRRATPTHRALAGEPTSGPTNADSTTSVVASVRDQAGDGHTETGHQTRHAVALTIHTDHTTTDNHRAGVGVDPAPPEPANYAATPRPVTPVLADPLLALAADVLDDIETIRIANENRLRQLTRDETDKDGEERGFGLTLDHPDVSRTAMVVAGFLCTSNVVQELGIPKPARRSGGCCLEHDAERNLKHKLATHPLGPWMKSVKGIGEKQGARLLGAIGDPYIRPEIRDKEGNLVAPARTRTLSQLRRYCGYHVITLPGDQNSSDSQIRIVAGDHTSSRQVKPDTHAYRAAGNQPPTGHLLGDTQKNPAGGDQTGSDPDQNAHGTQAPPVGVAATRTRGQRITWSPTARKRARLVADSIVKVGRGGPYREIYDQGRRKYADAIHTSPCKRCGPAGKPAPAGSPLSESHKDGRARRLVVRAILKGLWQEAKRIHQGEPSTTPPCS